MKSKGILVIAIIGTMFMSSVTVFGNAVVIKAQNGMYQPDHVISSLTEQRGLTVTWKKVRSASGYVVTQKMNGGKGNKTVTLVGKNSTKYVAKNLKKNRVYSFTVKAYKWKNNKKLYSKVSKIKGYTGLKRPDIYDRTTSANKITAAWSTGEITSKVQIYRSEKKNGSYKKVAVVKSKITY